MFEEDIYGYMFYLACHTTAVWESHQNTKSGCKFTQVIST